jgi:hypothetical protein
MFSTLESLVLRGVSVLRDGQTVEVRLGASAEDARMTPEIRVSMRPPQGYPIGFTPSERPDHVVTHGVDKAVYGAGRSLSCVGVLSRRNPARNAGRTNPKGRSGPSLRPNTRNAIALRVIGCQANALQAIQRSTGTVAWCKPATRTPPASTRGKGAW